MCSRYFISQTNEEMRRFYEKADKFYGDTLEFERIQTGDIFPTNVVPIIIPEYNLNVDIVPMQWGFLSQKSNKPLINARCETIFNLPTWRGPIKNKRCVVPANGFYEWNMNKQKYYITPINSSLLYFAAIFDKKYDERAKKSYARFTIITKEARGLMRSIHTRMPVNLKKHEVLKFLNGNENDLRQIFNDLTSPEYNFQQTI